jgi:hypothetical protein
LPPALVEAVLADAYQAVAVELVADLLCGEEVSPNILCAEKFMKIIGIESEVAVQVSQDGYEKEGRSGGKRKIAADVVPYIIIF